MPSRPTVAAPTSLSKIAEEVLHHEYVEPRRCHHKVVRGCVGIAMVGFDIWVLEGDVVEHGAEERV
jgi:hypothetical protein